MGAMNDKNRSSLLIGIHSVDSAMTRQPEGLQLVMIAGECRNPRVILLEDRARQLGIRVRRESRVVLDRRSGDQRHQDIIADFLAANIWAEKDLDSLLDAAGDSPLILVLDGVQDPHNLGACLRTADAAGVDFVIVSRDRSAGLTATARRSAAGAAEALPILVAGNLARVMRQLKKKGVWLAGTAESATESLYDLDLGGPLALVMGSEGKGIRRLTAELCDYLVRIPMHGTVSSLNVSVASAICLFEIARQRRKE
jgi:23S rRNA (guanosine2251-2'-O)-methyltransferase